MSSKYIVNSYVQQLLDTTLDAVIRSHIVLDRVFQVAASMGLEVMYNQDADLYRIKLTDAAYTTLKMNMMSGGVHIDIDDQTSTFADFDITTTSPINEEYHRFPDADVIAITKTFIEKLKEIDFSDVNQSAR